MVLLRDLFHLLASGEFSSISLSRTSTGGLNESEYEKVIGHLNLGIVEIYKRFRFLENELTLHADPRVTKYYLREDRIADLHHINTQRYIERPSDPDGCLNIIEITGVFNEAGDEYTMNNRFKTPCILQKANDILTITKLTAPEKLSIVYQAYPSKITMEDDFNPREIVVPIPETIIEALLYYVASRVYKPMGSNDSTANADKSASYQQQFELSCQKLEFYGLDPDNQDAANTFEERGWV